MTTTKKKRTWLVAAALTLLMSVAIPIKAMAFDRDDWRFDHERWEHRPVVGVYVGHPYEPAYYPTYNPYRASLVNERASLRYQLNSARFQYNLAVERGDYHAARHFAHAIAADQSSLASVNARLF